MKIIKNLILISFILLYMINLSAASKWQGKIPVDAQNPENWKTLLSKLLEEKKYYSAMAAANRMLIFFNDLQTKEAAYQAILTVADEGFPFSTKQLYITGDIEPKVGYHFVNNYNLYKGIVNSEAGLDRWAQHYFLKVDKEQFSRYQFYTALKAYGKKEYQESINIINKLLKIDHGEKNKAFVKKLARTLARIYFEMEDFERAADIYTSFLLKTNPIKPSDWLEAAWSFYHLKQYDKALGMVYNLESKTFGEVIQLEKYILRALIYREVCEITFMEGLAVSFEDKFGEIVLGVKKGQTLSEFKELNLLSSNQHKNFFKYHFLLRKLQTEASIESTLSSVEETLFQYLFETEQVILIKNAELFEEESRYEAVKYLILLSENLKFLKFDVILEKYNPDVVFDQNREKDQVSKDEKPHPFSFYWPQDGNFWADELTNYLGRLKSKCQSK